MRTSSPTALLASLVTTAFFTGCATPKLHKLPTRQEMNTKTANQIKTEYQDFVNYSDSKMLFVSAFNFPEAAPLIDTWGEPTVKKTSSFYVWEFDSTQVEVTLWRVLARGFKPIVLKMHISDKSSNNELPSVANAERPSSTETNDVSLNTDSPDRRKNVEAQLIDLKSLRDDNILTEQEYQTRRQALIDQL